MSDPGEVLAVEEVMGRQPAFRRRIWRLLLEGHSQSEAARELGVSRQRLYYHVTCIRKSLAEAGFDVAALRRRHSRRTHRRLARGLKTLAYRGLSRGARSGPPT